jgi:hypothetical protein
MISCVRNSAERSVRYVLDLSPPCERCRIFSGARGFWRSSGRTAFAWCASEVQTNFGGRGGRDNPNKLFAEDIADTIMAGLNLPRRVLWPEVAVFANNPWKED